MTKEILPESGDPMGAAIADFHRNHKADRLRVFSSRFDEDEIPVKHLFRDYKQMSALERCALDHAAGRILDAGAGSGCHSLALQKAGKDVTPVDISPLSVMVMKERGLENAMCVNLFDNEKLNGNFDTVLLLMNGSGIIGKLANMPAFFDRMRELLSPGGCILMDSSDLSYLYEDENGEIEINLAGDYYGEVDFTMQYKNITGNPFDWLYIDFNTLSFYAEQAGFKVEMMKINSDDKPMSAYTAR